MVGWKELVTSAVTHPGRLLSMELSRSLPSGVHSTTTSGLALPTQFSGAEPSGHSHPHRPDAALLLAHHVAVAVGHFPLAVLAAVYLGGTQGIAARPSIDRARRMLETGGVSHLTYCVECLQL
jgi:hypothetical protein